jgi:hypothetical protein
VKLARILFAGAIFSSAIFAQRGDPGAAERFRMKFGRSIAAEASTANPSHNRVATTSCECCHGKHV